MLVNTFYGTVHLMDWISAPTGQIRALEGTVDVKSDEEVAGFKARGSNSANWLAIITGETSKWVLFGCQIRGFTQHSETSTRMVDTYLVP